MAGAADRWSPGPQDPAVIVSTGALPSPPHGRQISPIRRRLRSVVCGPPISVPVVVSRHPAHKSQATITADQPIKHAVIDIGKREFNAGLTFVALSRAKTLYGIALDPMPPCNRLQRISQGVQLQHILAHHADLTRLGAYTYTQWGHLLVNDPMFDD